MRNIIWFKDLGIGDIAEVGGKNASLGEMYNALVSKGINLPNGFAVTSGAYQNFLKESGLDKKITEVLKDLDTKNISNLQLRGKKIRKMIMEAELPLSLEQDIIEAYQNLSKEFSKQNVDVAVRSSATAEDLPGASFAGQQETYLNISHNKNVLFAVKQCFASLFTDRAMSYRVDKGFDHMKTYLSVGIQKMVRSDKGSSGVMFTIDTETGFQDAVVINSSLGLGELIVQGKVIPDEFMVFKPTLKQGYKPIFYKKMGSKEISMIYSKNKDRFTEVIKNTEAVKNKFSLSDEEIIKLAEWGVMIEEHYGKPMDIEWAKDGISKELYIVQARPETIHQKRNMSVITNYVLKSHKGNKITEGSAIGAKIASGKARVIKGVSGIKDFKAGEILVTTMTDPDWEPIMKIASAIITDSGGRTSHAAIVSRELGIPCVVGANNATKLIKTGDIITVDCSSGSKGEIWSGQSLWEVIEYPATLQNRPHTKIMMNIGNPDEAFFNSFIPNDGVGLAREEFITASTLKVHPLALINFKSLKDEKIKKEIEKITLGYSRKEDFYISKLAEGISKIAVAFYPKPVILRLSDFKTNEYASLVGGKDFEPVESNPMIGWRGASRYYDSRFEKAFELECLAIKKAREEFGLTNLIVMVPFCRTLEEGRKVIDKMSSYGLKKGDNGLQVYVMCEIPSNIILAEDFLDVFDGMSIGSNDLTQLILGIDRDNAELGAIADERNEAVKKVIADVIKITKKRNKYIGICGQAPSDYPEFASFLVEEGINSISLNPDVVLKTTELVTKLEERR